MFNVSALRLDDAFLKRVVAEFILFPTHYKASSDSYQPIRNSQE